MVHSATNTSPPTSSRGENLVRRFLEGGVGLHTSPRPSNIHKADASLLECPLLLLGFPDGIDIGSKAEEGETFRRLILNLLRADGDGADERGSDEQDSSNERGGELHGGGPGAEVLATEGGAPRMGAKCALLYIKFGVE